MAKISDIFKKKTPPPASSEEPKSAQFSQIIPQKESDTESVRQKSQGTEVSKVINKLKPDTAEYPNIIYSKGIQLVKDLLKAADEKKPLELRPIKELVEETVNCFSSGERTLFNLFYADYAPDEYLYNHMINVMVLSVAVGLKLGYSKARLNELGLIAFLHDIQIIDIKNIEAKPAGISEEEYNRIKERSICSEQMFSKIDGFKEAIVNAIKEQQAVSRQGLMDADVSEYGRIIATVNVYESLVHSRTYRKQFPPYEAIKEMISTGSSLFDTQVFKVLVDLIGIYPIGSYIELNTKEIAKVAIPNDNFPLRPVVNIIFDANGRRLEEPRLVNLSKQFNLYIKKPLSEDEVSRLVKE